MIQTVAQKTSSKHFSDFYLSEKTLQAINEVGYSTPTPVQSQAVPLIIAGLDLIVMSQTGTGKTAAFTIPTVEILDPTPGQIDILVLTPTRELATQVASEFEKIGKFKEINVATIYGGTGYEKQIGAIEKANVIVATPGRLVDLIQSNKCNLSGIKHFILDEADEMLSMGFAEAVDLIIEHLPEERQSLLFSATITPDVKSLAKRLLFFPEYISMSDNSIATQDVTHVWYPVRGVGRTRELLRIIEFEQPEQAIVFANTKNDTVKISESLNKHGIQAAILNGDMPQKERERTLQQFRDNGVKLLVATDVAARGIDIHGLTHIFNYVVPENAEVYIHRAGRTGRAGCKGRAISLVSPAEFPTLHTVKKHYGVEPIQSEIPTTHQIIEAKRKKHLNALANQLANQFDLPYGAKIGLANQLAQSALSDPQAIKLIARLLTLSDSLYDKDAKLSDLQKTQWPDPPANEPDIVTPTSSPEKEIPPTPPVQTTEVAQIQQEKLDLPQETKEEQEKTTERRYTRSKGKEGEPHPPSSDDKTDETPQDTRKFQRSKKETSPETSAETTSADATTTDNSRPSRRLQASLDKDKPIAGRRRRHRLHKSETSSHTQETSTKFKSYRKKDETSNTYSTSSSAFNPFDQKEFTYKKLWINLGSSIFSTETELKDAVVFLSGFGPEDFDNIQMEKSSSFLDVREDYFDDILESLSGQKWANTTIAVEAARK